MLSSICLLVLLGFQNPSILRENVDRGDTGPPVQEQFTVSFVQLDILALDKKGNPVTDLKKSDFVIRDAGKKIQLDYFRPVDLREQQNIRISPEGNVTQEDTANSNQDAARQELVLVLDFEDVPVTEATRTFKQLREYITSLDQSGAPFHMMVTSLEYGPVTKTYQTSAETVLNDLDTFAETYYRVRVDSSRKQWESESLIGSMDSKPSGPYGRSANSSFLQRGPAPLAALENALQNCNDLFRGEWEKREQCIELSLEDFLERHFLRTRRVLGELRSLVSKFESDDNPKTMLLISPGFAVESMDAAYQMAYFYQQQVEDDRSSIMSATRDLFKNKEFERSYREFLHMVMARRIMFHVFDIYTGMDQLKREGSAEFRLSSPTTKRFYSQYNDEISGGLRTVAQDTGGTYHQSFQMGVPMDKAIRGTRFLYEVGYSAPEGKKGAWHKIRIKCKRKGVKLIYRRGYFGN